MLRQLRSTSAARNEALTELARRDDEDNLQWGARAVAEMGTGGSDAWTYVVLLSLGSVLAANFLFFAGVRRIDAAPTAVAATIEPVVGTLLALLLFDQRLSPLGWLGLAMVVGGVAAGYLKEAQERPDET